VPTAVRSAQAHPLTIFGLAKRQGDQGKGIKPAAPHPRNEQQRSCRIRPTLLRGPASPALPSLRSETVMAFWKVGAAILSTSNPWCGKYSTSNRPWSLQQSFLCDGPRQQAARPTHRNEVKANEIGPSCVRWAFGHCQSRAPRGEQGEEDSKVDQDEPVLERG